MACCAFSDSNRKQESYKLKAKSNKLNVDYFAFSLLAFSF